MSVGWHTPSAQADSGPGGLTRAELFERLTKALVTDADWLRAVDTWRRLRSAEGLSAPAESSQLTFSVRARAEPWVSFSSIAVGLGVEACVSV